MVGQPHGSFLEHALDRCQRITGLLLQDSQPPLQQQVPHHVVHHRKAQRSFVREVMVQGAFGDAGPGEDAIQAGRLKPAPVNLVKRSCEQLFPGDVRFALAGLGGPLWHGCRSSNCS
jgi:hypothetical protein